MYYWHLNFINDLNLGMITIYQQFRKVLESHHMNYTCWKEEGNSKRMFSFTISNSNEDLERRNLPECAKSNLLNTRFLFSS